MTDTLGELEAYELSSQPITTNWWLVLSDVFREPRYENMGMKKQPGSLWWWTFARTKVSSWNSSLIAPAYGYPMIQACIPRRWPTCSSRQLQVIGYLLPTKYMYDISIQSGILLQKSTLHMPYVRTCDKAWIIPQCHCQPSFLEERSIYMHTLWQEKTRSLICANLPWHSGGLRVPRLATC